LDGEKKLCNLLGLWWGDGSSPINVKSATPRAYMLANPLAVEAWRKAWEWRQVLEEAAAER